LENAKGGVILVSNEIGQGVIPQGAISRWFVDESGRLNQDIAAVCDRAVLIVAGLPLALKG
jgi:adenosylcobinamide kinase/adenosylcobinamide-phosphate guanylyltransferase